MIILNLNIWLARKNGAAPSNERGTWIFLVRKEVEGQAEIFAAYDLMFSEALSKLIVHLTTKGDRAYVTLRDWEIFGDNQGSTGTPNRAYDPSRDDGRTEATPLSKVYGNSRQ